MTEKPASVVDYLEPHSERELMDRLSATEREILDTINRKVAARDSIESIVEFLFESARAVTPCDRVSVAFLDQDERLVSHTIKADYEPLCLTSGYVEDPRRGSLHDVLRHGRIRIIRDLERYLEDHPRSASTRLLLREGVRSSLTCPLAVEGRVIGALFRSARRPHAYEMSHAAFQQALAERLSQAVDKVRQIELLRAANEAYLEMLGFVTHELRSPVASMMANAQILHEGYLGSLSAEQEGTLRRIINSGEYLNVLIREYLDLARLEGHELAAEIDTDVDFSETLLAPTLDIIRPQWERKKMRFEQDVPADLPPLRLDPQLFKIVLVNLLGNAVKYGADGGRLRLRAAVENRTFTLSVWNEGPGFSPEERQRLFRKFSRLKNPELLKQKGTGVGLYTTWRIVKLHGGRIDARSEPGRWAEFFLEIPQVN